MRDVFASASADLASLYAEQVERACRHAAASIGITEPDPIQLGARLSLQEHGYEDEATGEYVMRRTDVALDGVAVIRVTMLTEALRNGGRIVVRAEPVSS